MLGLLLVLAAFGSFYLGDITAFTTSQKAIAGVADVYKRQIELIINGTDIVNILL